MRKPKFIGSIQKYRHELVALGFSLLGLYYRFEKLAGRELWLDEISQFNFTFEPFKVLWLRKSPGNDITSFPGDYLLNYFFVTTFGMNKWALAIPHLIVTVLGFYLAYLICKKYFTTVWATAAAFAVISCNSSLVYHSLELRPYAVLPTLALGCFYFMGEIFTSGDFEKNRNKRIWLGVFFFVTVLYHVYGIFIVFFTGMYHFLTQMKDSSFTALFKKHYRYFGKILLASIPFWIWFTSAILILMKQQLFELDTIYTFTFIPNPFENMAGFLKGIFGNLIGASPLYFLILGIPLAMMIPNPDKMKQLGYFLVLIVLPIEYLVVTDTLKSYWFIQRQFVWVMPLFAVFLGWCWESVLIFGRSVIFKKNLSNVT